MAVARLLDGAPIPSALRDPPAPGVPWIAILGGGFSGTLTAAQLLRGATAGGARLHVVVIDREGAFAAGAAYATTDDRHLLNVPAARMSAWPDRPDSFLAWAQARDAGAAGTDFLPRMHYGAYLRDELIAAARDAGPGVTLELRHCEVISVAPDPAGFVVVSRTTPVITAAAVVLATGHRAPSDPLAAVWRGPRTRWIGAPWPAIDAQLGGHAIASDAPVVLLGTGLSAIDVVLSLTRQPRSSPIIAVSRRGLVPRSHASRPSVPALAPPAPPPDLGPVIDAWLAAPGGPRVRDLVRRVAAAARAGDWRAAVDAIRPHSARIWRALPPADAAAFLRHVRPLWEVHRHRMAPPVAAWIADQQAGGGLRVIAGRVRAVTATESAATLEIDLRHGERDARGAGEAITAGWVVNCTGPGDQRTAPAPALASLIAAGVLEPDALGLGVLTGAQHEAIAHGRHRDDLFVIGTLCKPALWESTAVPELRGQAATIARAVLARLAP